MDAEGRELALTSMMPRHWHFKASVRKAVTEYFSLRKVQP